jgi:hypothetical protein
MTLCTLHPTSALMAEVATMEDQTGEVAAPTPTLIVHAYVSRVAAHVVQWLDVRMRGETA